MVDYLTPERCALLVIDLQERLLPVIENRDRVEKKSKILIKAARSLQMPVIATTQYAARIGAIVPEIAKELGQLTPVDKMEFSCFNNEEFCHEIASLPKSIDTFVVCGVEAHICVYQTVLGGVIAGYHMWVTTDAVSSRTAFNYENGLERIKEIGGVPASSELIIYELLGKAGSRAFKELLPFLK